MKSLPGRFYCLRLYWDGPKVPMMLAAHSGDHWYGRPAASVEGSELLAAFNEYISSSAAGGPVQEGEFYLGVEIGGVRPVHVPVAISVGAAQPTA